MASTTSKVFKKALTLPALPIVSITHPDGRGSSQTSPSHPSPLRDVSVAGMKAEASLRKNASTIIPGTQHPEHIATTKGSATMTQQNDSKLTGPLVVDSTRPFDLLSRSASAGNIQNMVQNEAKRSTPWIFSTSGLVGTEGVDDPFLTTPDRPKSALSNASITLTPQTLSHAIQPSVTPLQEFSPREDRLSQPVTPANAQGRFAPEACVFVANLSSARSDDQLEFSVEQALSSYGKCYVKINHDKNKMPYAFVQFEAQDDARLCIQHARGLVIDGRPIRTEHAKAHRSVYLTNITGGPISDEEARRVLGRFGAIQETCPTTIADQELAGLPEGIWVKYRYFMDCKDAISSCRHDPNYRLIVHSLEEPRRRPGSTVSPSPSRGPRRGNRYGSDAKSIFVGNLPQDLTEDELRSYFNTFGQISECKIIRKALGGGHQNTFAFIEFNSVHEAERAQVAQFVWGGKSLRVEPKRYTLRRNTRLFQSPEYNYSQQEDAYHIVYNQGMGIQRPTNNTNRMFSPPRYENASAMQEYNHYGTPPYTSPVALRGVNNMSPQSVYYGSMSPSPYYGQYMSPYGTMQSIAEHAEHAEVDGAANVGCFNN